MRGSRAWMLVAALAACTRSTAPAPTAPAVAATPDTPTASAPVPVTGCDEEDARAARDAFAGATFTLVERDGERKTIEKTFACPHAASEDECRDAARAAFAPPAGFEVTGVELSGAAAYYESVIEVDGARRNGKHVEVGEVADEVKRLVAAGHRVVIISIDRRTSAEGRSATVTMQGRPASKRRLIEGTVVTVAAEPEELLKIQLRIEELGLELRRMSSGARDVQLTLECP